MANNGSCGRFQITRVLLILLSRFVSIWGIFLMLFGNYNPGWRCVMDDSKVNGSQRTTGDGNDIRNNHWRESSLQINATFNGDLSQVVNTNFTSMTEIPEEDFLYNGTCDTIALCKRIEFNPESSTIISEYELICDRSWIPSLILIVVNAGFIVGSITFGQVSERYGRKVGLYSSTAMMAVSSGAAIFSPNWATYTVFTFFIGASGFGILSISVVFSMEFLNSKWRGFLASKPIGSLSLCVLSLIITLFKNWWYLHIATCTMAAISLLGCFIVTESPRWLFVYSQEEKAVKILQKIANENGVSLTRVRSCFDNRGVEKQFEKTRCYSYLDLFRKRVYFVTTIKFSALMINVVLIYHALTFGVKSIPGNFYTNVIIASFIQAPVVMSSGPISNVIGRRRAGFVYSLLGVAASLTIVISLFTSEGYTQTTIIQASVYGARAVTQAALSVTLLCAVETFPTAIRSIGVSFVNGIAGVGGLVAPYVIPREGSDASFAVCFSVMGLCLLVNVVIFYSFSETKRFSLRDSLIEKPTREQDDLI